MTPKKSPTIAELRQEARRVDPKYGEASRSVRAAGLPTVLYVEAKEFVLSTGDTPRWRRFILAGLRTLPSAQKKGTKRCRK